MPDQPTSKSIQRRINIIEGRPVNEGVSEPDISPKTWEDRVAERQRFESGLPLAVYYSDTTLTITIGVNTLAQVYESGRGALDPDLDRASHKISDPVEFAKDVALALCNDDDGGRSILSMAINEAMDCAVGDGSLGVEYVGVRDE